jgi:hypothetical protein
VRSVAGRAHDGDDLFDLGRIGRIAQTLVAWSVPGVESRQRRRRSTSTGAVEQKLGHDPSSGSWNEPRLSAPVDARPTGPPAALSHPTASSGQSRSATAIAPASKQKPDRRRRSNSVLFPLRSHRLVAARAWAMSPRPAFL